MLTPPDPERRYTAMLSTLVQQGNKLVERYQHISTFLWHAANGDTSSSTEREFTEWLQQAQTTLQTPDREEFLTILVDGEIPDWQKAWDLVVGRATLPQFSQDERYEVAFRGILRRFGRLLDYLKALRLRHAPASPFSSDFYEQFAAQFHRMSPYTIDDCFINSGCVIQYWIPPYKPQTKKTAERVYGWLDGLNLYMPDALITMVETVYQAYRDYKQFPRHLPLDHIQVALRTLNKTSTTAATSEAPSPFAHYAFHPRVIERATPFWMIQEYDTALLHVCIELDRAVQAKSGINDHGTALMRMAFSPKKPRILIDPRFGNQQGFMDLFAGVMDAIRNPRAHHHTSKLSKDEALEWLAFLSALFRVLDAATMEDSHTGHPTLPT